MDFNQILELPPKGYQVSVEAVLFSNDGSAVCLVLERGGQKQKGLFSYSKPTAWGNPGGGVENGETPKKGILREIEEETGVPKDKIELFGEPEIFTTGNDNKLHHKIIFTARLLCDLSEYPLLHQRDTLARDLVKINELPSPNAHRYWSKDGYGILPTHLDHILANQRAALI